MKEFEAEMIEAAKAACAHDAKLHLSKQIKLKKASPIPQSYHPALSFPFLLKRKEQSPFPPSKSIARGIHFQFPGRLRHQRGRPWGPGLWRPKATPQRGTGHSHEAQESAPSVAVWGVFKNRGKRETERVGTCCEYAGVCGA